MVTETLRAPVLERQYRHFPHNSGWRASQVG